MGLTKASITRPVFIVMVMLAAVLMGLLSYSGMRKELNPEVAFGTVTVQTIYTGAGPEEINNLVSRPIESAISGVNGIREVTSTSREGLSVVTAQFNLETNLDAALNDMRSKIDGIANDLPKDAKKPQISKVDPTATPVGYYAFTASGIDNRGLRDLLDQKLKDRYSQVPGVASADVTGGDIREIQVRVDKDKLLAYKIGISEIQQAVQSATLNIPAGKLLSGNQEYSVRVLGEFSNADQIRNMIIHISDPNDQRGPGRTVRLSDVAKVEDTAQERTVYSRLNGKDTIVVGLIKAHDGNAIEIINGADALSQSLMKDYSGIGLKIEKTTDVGKQVQDSLNDLSFALYFGILLVAVIVYMFLHNLRGTMIVVIAIPTSIFFTFIALKLGGFTINNMSMLALSLAIGVLVDDAIVVIENISRHLKMGEEPHEAAMNGRMEIGLAALAITFADVVVFLPLAFVPGVSGQFFRPLAIGFVFATLFSLLVSFTVTPMLASRWYRKGEDLETANNAFSRAFEKGFGWFEKRYEAALEWSLHHRWFVFILGNLALLAVVNFLIGGNAPTLKDALFGPSIKFLVLTLVGGAITMVVNAVRGNFSLKFLLYGFLFGLIFPVASIAGFGYHQWKQSALFNFAFIPQTDGNSVTVNIEMPVGTNLATTGQVVEEVERRLKGIKDVKYVLATVGQQSGGSFANGSVGSNYAQVQLTLVDKRTIEDSIHGVKELRRDRSDTSVAAEVVQRVGRIPGAFIKVANNGQFSFGSAIQMGLGGDNRDELIATAIKIRDAISSGQIPGIINADISSKAGKPEFQAIPDRARIADYNTSVQEVGSSLRTLYSGNDDAKFRVNGNEYAIRVMMSYKDRDNPNLLSQVPLKFINGNPIFLSSVAPLQQAPAIDHIDRRNRLEEVLVTSDLLPGYSAGTVQSQIDAYIKAHNLIPATIQYKPLGQADTQARESGGLFLAFLIGLVLVYMLLASLFNNYLYPLIIQMAQPQALVGALLALIFTDKALTVIGFIGLISLVGLVGKNAILLVDYTNTLRAKGRTRHDALVEAGPTRLRPIMMTTLALILGMLPVALAIGAGSEFRETIGIIVIGGITLSTLLTLLVIPCSYTIFDDISRWFMGVRGKDPDAPGDDPHFAEPMEPKENPKRLPTIGGEPVARMTPNPEQA